MIKAIAIDDEPLPLEILTNYCSRSSQVNLLASFNRLSKAQDYLNAHKVDLIFLDIQMPAMTGIDFYKKLNKETLVIFTTAYSQYAVEGFNLDAVDYLLKPFDYHRFQQAIEKVKKHIPDKTEQTIQVTIDYGKHQIAVRDIYFVEGLADYLRLHLDAQKPVVIRSTMKDMEKILGPSFARVHRSYIVNLTRIQSVRNKTITINEQQISIGKTHWERFKKLYFHKPDK